MSIYGNIILFREKKGDTKKKGHEKKKKRKKENFYVHGFMNGYGVTVAAADFLVIYQFVRTPSPPSYNNIKSHTYDKNIIAQYSTV